jgi:hypothetical protein
MKYLELILQFLISLVEIFFPRKKKTDDTECTCTDSLPDPPLPVLPVERRDGSDAGSPRSDPFPPVAERRGKEEALPADERPCFTQDGGQGASLAMQKYGSQPSGQDVSLAMQTCNGQPLPTLRETYPGADWLGISGYTLMLTGGVACVLKALL